MIKCHTCKNTIYYLDSVSDCGICNHVHHKNELNTCKSCCKDYCFLHRSINDDFCYECVCVLCIERKSTKRVKCNNKNCFTYHLVCHKCSLEGDVIYEIPIRVI